MLIDFKRGQGSIILRAKILDSTVATGAGKTGLAFNTSGLVISTIADNEASATVYSVGSSNVEDITTIGTYSAPSSNKCRFKAVDGTNHKGVYEIQLADARYAVSNAKSLLISIYGATGAAETDCVIPLRSVDPYDATAMGIGRLDAAISSRSTYAGGDTAGVTTLLTRIIGTLASGTHSPQSGDSYSIVNNGTYGNSALNTDIDALLARLTSARGGYLDKLNVAGTLAQQGDQMDLINSPNATARDAIAVTVESHLLDEGDSQLLINAIVGAIGNTNVDEVALVAALRADLERTGGNLHTLLARLVGTIAAGTHQPQSGDGYGIVSSGAHGNAALKTLIDDRPTVAQFNARTLVAAAYFDFTTDSVMLTAGERNSIADALLDREDGVEDDLTPRQSFRLTTAAAAGKRSNAGTSDEQFDAAMNPGTARIVGNLDADGNGTPTLTP